MRDAGRTDARPRAQFSHLPHPSYMYLLHLMQPDACYGTSQSRADLMVHTSPMALRTARGRRQTSHHDRRLTDALQGQSHTVCQYGACTARRRSRPGRNQKPAPSRRDSTAGVVAEDSRGLLLPVAAASGCESATLMVRKRGPTRRPGSASQRMAQRSPRSSGLAACSNGLRPAWSRCSSWAVGPRGA